MIEKGFATRIRREIASYQVMSGSLNVCCFYGAYETPTHLYLVTELCTGIRYCSSNTAVSKNFVAFRSDFHVLQSSRLSSEQCNLLWCCCLW